MGRAFLNHLPHGHCFIWSSHANRFFFFLKFWNFQRLFQELSNQYYSHVLTYLNAFLTLISNNVYDNPKCLHFLQFCKLLDSSGRVVSAKINVSEDYKTCWRVIKLLFDAVVKISRSIKHMYVYTDFVYCMDVWNRVSSHERLNKYTEF